MMDKVTRYAVIPDLVYGHDKFGPVCKDSEAPHYVLASHYDAAQFELAALREAYEAMRDRKNSIVDLQQRLAAAEQRNAALSDALLKIIEMNRQHAKDQYGDAEKAELWSCITVARAALKPAAPAQKICIECGQPYCLGVCVERVDDQEVPRYEQ